MSPDVSFVIPTRDAARTIDACLRSLREQTAASVEIVVVDNGSADDTVARASRYADRVLRAGPERSAQRNAGARAANGDVLVFVDADMVLEPGVARACVDMLAADPTLGALVVPERSFGRGFLARCRALEKQLYFGDERVEAARAFRRTGFERVGGYDESIVAFEDWDLADRVRSSGHRVGRITDGIWHDDGRVSVVAQFRKKRYYGRRSGTYLAMRGSSRRRRLARTSLLARPGALARRPVHALGLAFLKTAECSGLALGALQAANDRRRARLAAITPLSHGPAHGGVRVLHVVGEFDRNEGIGRSIVELVERVPGEHHLVASRIGRGADAFTSAYEVGGSMAWFPITRHRLVARIRRELAIDVVHLHGGPLVTLWAPSRALRARDRVVSIYCWPRVPPLRSLQRATWRAAARSQVLRPRVVLGSLLPDHVYAGLLRAGRVRHVLSPDPRTSEHLASPRLTVKTVNGGAAPDPRRARLDPERPTIVFAGRAESVRGIDTLLDALTILATKRRLTARLLLLQRAETESLAQAVEARRLGQVVQVVTDPIDDLAAEFARASVAVFPFKFDYVTIPPALTIAEAMSVGLPVVGTDVVCVTAILRHDENGIVIPVDDPAALAAALDALLADPERWRRLSLNAARHVTEARAWETVAAAAARAYGIEGEHELVAGTRAG